MKHGRVRPTGGPTTQAKPNGISGKFRPASTPDFLANPGGHGRQRVAATDPDDDDSALAVDHHVLDL
jgi:hypothetical protein